MKTGSIYISILLKYLLPVYVVALGILTLFRVLFIVHFYDDFLLLYKTTDELQPILIRAMAKGFRYDNMVLSYLMVVPLLALIVSWIAKIRVKALLTLLRGYIALAFFVVFALSCIDYPYFSYFWTHPTVTIFDWIGFGGTFGMVVQESSYYPYFLLFILSWGIILVTSHVAAKWATKGTDRISIFDQPIVQVPVFLLAIALCFFGTRGQLSKDSIGLNAAYFTDNILVSNLCITPAYHFMVYLDDYKIDLADLMPHSEALTNAQSYLHSNSTDAQYPLRRRISADSTQTSTDKHIVLIFMESMGANQLHQEENGMRLTPFLDSLAASSYYFQNIYSSGVHTNAGVGSTLVSIPSLLHEHMMPRNPTSYNSILSELKKAGYSTSFFLPNEEVYDNMGLFLRANYIDTVFSDNHYPKEAKANNFGVPDSYLFNFAIDELNKQAQQGKPFFSAILTVSNHPPYVVPEPFTQISDNKEKAILAYADHAIGEFFQKASKQSWYSNTIFVLLGDHGKRTGSQGYNMSLDYNHIPLIIFSPSFEDMPRQFAQYGGQIDVMPTIMGMLNRAYDNNTLGIDLLRNDKPYTFFTSDTYIGCVDSLYFYTFNPRDKREDLYSRANNGIAVNDSICRAMKSYSLSMLSVASFLNKQKNDYFRDEE